MNLMDEARRLKMRGKLLKDGTFALITEDEARREYGAIWLSDLMNPLI